MTDEPDKENNLFSEPMKIFIAVAGARAVEQAGDLLLAFELVEQVADAVEIGGGAVDQIGLPRTIRTGRAAPSSDQLARPRSTRVRGQRVERRAVGADLAAQAAAPLGQRQAGQPRVDIIGRLGQRRRRSPGGQVDHAVLDAAVGADQHRERAGRRERDEAELAQRPALPAAPARCRRRRERPDSAAVVRPSASSIGPARSSCASIAAASSASVGAALHHAVDEQAQAAFGRHPPGRGMRRGEQARFLQILHDVADRGRREVERREREMVREPTGAPLSR